MVKCNYYQLLSDFYLSNILIGDFHFLPKSFPVRYLYFYAGMTFGYFIQDWLYSQVAASKVCLMQTYPIIYAINYNS